jgi:hypothetical protein
MCKCRGVKIMKETRKISISRKIFSKKDLKLISKIFTNEYQQSYESENSASLKFSCTFSDNTSIESDSSIIFEEDGLLDMRKSSLLDFTFWDYSDDKYINFRIRHGDYGPNEVIISGHGETWTRCIFDKFEDTLKYIKPQSNFFKHKYFINIVLSCIIGFYIFWILEKPITKIFILGTPNDVGLISFMFGLIGTAIVTPLLNWLIELWPIIEFDFGPEHMRNEKNKRIRVGIALTVFIIPIIIGKFII